MGVVQLRQALQQRVADVPAGGDDGMCQRVVQTRGLMEGLRGAGLTPLSALDAKKVNEVRWNDLSEKLFAFRMYVCTPHGLFLSGFQVLERRGRRCKLHGVFITQGNNTVSSDFCWRALLVIHPFRCRNPCKYVPGR